MSGLCLQVTEMWIKILLTVLIHQKVRLRGGMSWIDQLFCNLCKINQFNSSVIKKNFFLIFSKKRQEETSGRKEISRRHKTNQIDTS